MVPKKKKVSLWFIILGAILSGYAGYLLNGAWEPGGDINSFLEPPEIFSVIVEELLILLRIESMLRSLCSATSVLMNRLVHIDGDESLATNNLAILASLLN